MCFRMSLELIHFKWNADRSSFLQWCLAMTYIYSSLNSAPISPISHLTTTVSQKDKWRENRREREPDSNIRAAQTSHKLNGTQMTEVIKCSLCHCSISEALLHSIFLSFHKSVSTLGSLKWQCVCASCAEEECRRQGWSLFVLADSRVTFTTYWRHGHISSEAFVSII